MQIKLKVGTTGKSEKGTLWVKTFEGVKYNVDKKLTWNPVVGVEYSVGYENTPFKGKDCFWIKSIEGGQSSGAASNAPQTNGKGSFGAKSPEDYRIMCLSYAKDLVIAKTFELQSMYAVAERMVTFVKGEKGEVEM